MKIRVFYGLLVGVVFAVFIIEGISGVILLKKIAMLDSINFEKMVVRYEGKEFAYIKGSREFDEVYSALFTVLLDEKELSDCEVPRGTIPSKFVDITLRDNILTYTAV